MCADAHKDSGSLWVSVCLCAFLKEHVMTAMKRETSQYSPSADLRFDLCFVATFRFMF